MTFVFFFLLLLKGGLQRLLKVNLAYSIKRAAQLNLLNRRCLFNNVYSLQNYANFVKYITKLFVKLFYSR